MTDHGKIVKQRPSATPQDLINDFDLIKKGTKTKKKSITKELTKKLVEGSLWKKEDWEKEFLTQPFLFAFAQTLVWGVFDDKNQFKSSFTPTSDTALEDQQMNEVILNANDTIGLAHPLHLSDTDTKNWKKYFADNNIKALIDQLDRPTKLVDDLNKQMKISDVYADQNFKITKFKSLAEKLNWEMGIEDSGYIYNYYRLFPSQNIAAIIEVENVARYFLGPEAEGTFGELYFVKWESDIYRNLNKPKTVDDKKLLSFEEVNPVFFSEIMTNMDQFIKDK